MEDDNIDMNLLRRFLELAETGTLSSGMIQITLDLTSPSQKPPDLNTDENDNAQYLAQVSTPVQSQFKTSDETSSDGHLYDNIVIQNMKVIPHLKIGFVDSIKKTIGMDILRLLQPKVKKISQVTGSASNLLSAMNSGDIDLAITVLHTKIPAEITSYPLIEEFFLCAYPKGWSDSQLDSLCKNHDYIAYPDNTFTGGATLRLLKNRNLIPSSQFEIDSANDILKMVSCGYGWTLTTPLYISTVPEVAGALKILKLNNQQEKREIVLLSKNDEFPELCRHLEFEIRSMLRSRITLQDDGQSGTITSV